MAAVVRRDLVFVDGQLGSCKTDVAAGQALQQRAPAAKKHAGPRVVSLDVLFEDDWLAVVHKPWGVKMYGGDARRTVTGALRAGALQASAAADALREPKPVHRLDAAVGGLLVVAKTTSALAALSEQFQARRVHKVYAALLSGRLEPAAAAAALQARREAGEASAASSSDEGGEDEEEDAAGRGEQAQQQQQLLLLELGLPQLLERQLQGQPAFTATAAELGDPSLEPGSDTSSSGSSAGGSGAAAEAAELVPGLGPGVRLVDLPLDGRPCYTLWRVLGHSRSPRFGGWMATAALSPVTGRKHQLRRHMAALGAPIVGDGKYAAVKEDHIANQGIYLESVEVSFNHPVSGELTHVRAREPPRFATLRQQQLRRWEKLERQAQQQQEEEEKEGQQQLPPAAASTAA